MKKLIGSSFLVLLLFSCKKTTSNETISVDQMQFGTFANYCIGDCAAFYKIQNAKLYPDTNSRYTGAGSIGFSPVALSNNKYLLAKVLQDSFPVYLLNHPNETYGCPDCADQGGLRIEIKKDSISSFWNIDTDVSKQPQEIKSYIEKLRTILTQL